MECSVKLYNAFVHAYVIPEMRNGFAVKTVHVLCDDMADMACMLKCCEGVMGGIRLCVPNGGISEV